MHTVSYQFYTQVYHGKLSEDDYLALSMRASAYVDDLTMGRSSGELTEADALRVDLALCAVADAMHTAHELGGVTSQTNDGVSVSYAADYAAATGQHVRDAAIVYLAQTNLLYRGHDDACVQ